MSKPPTSYIQLLQRGPFAGQVDPFGEEAQYFHQIHSGMIGAILAQIGQELLGLGYVASKETSIQISDITRVPDIRITSISGREAPITLDYAKASTAALAEPGVVAVNEEAEPDAIHIREMGTRRLVTVLEIISPRNKTHPDDMLKYQTQRTNLFLANGVNVMEIDLTRTYHRLFRHRLTENNPYNTVIFIAGANTHIVTHSIDLPLKRCALPLRQDVLPFDLQAAYEHAYLEALIAPQIFDNDDYQEHALPFPTLLTPEQREDIIRAVATWQAELKQLRGR